jgi:hypothetical protein
MKANETNIIYPELSYKIMGAIFEVHIMSYLKASGCKLGILVNFSKSRVEYQRVLIR